MKKREVNGLRSFHLLDMARLRQWGMLFSSRPLWGGAVNIACLMFVVTGPLLAQKSADPVMNSNPALIQVPEDPSLPRVLLIGDSISIGYTQEVRKLLSGRANVQHAPVNCESTEFGLAHLDEWIGNKHWDVIFFNFGLHDLKYLDEKGDYVSPDKGKQVTSIDRYGANLRKIVLISQKTGAKLIFATTTPVPSGSAGRVQGDEIAYNAAAIKVMQEMHVEVVDLRAVVLPRQTTLQLPHNVHFTAEGYHVLGAEVARRIADGLPKTRLLQ